jgi:hypothetical protein
MFRCCPIEQVYNVTDFLEGHPGGEDLILMHGGKDVTEIMQDPLEHEHSEFAFDMLKDYFIGRLDTGLVRKDRCVVCLHVYMNLPFFFVTRTSREGWMSISRNRLSDSPGYRDCRCIEKLHIGFHIWLW